ncbi:MAG TPA: hypothetical protein VK050_06670 [Flavobacteriaceae bacterium]|nr:hypothetical protein [Flavobacteriaceae bacterium]
MKKWQKRIGIVIIAILLLGGLAYYGLKYAIKDAFGTKYRTVKIELADGDTLICKEKYSADLAAVFYDIDFTLKDKENEYFLGRSSYQNEGWESKIKPKKIGEWTILPVKWYSKTKILQLNKNQSSIMDTTFSAQNLRNDSIWKNLYNEIPTYTYEGKTTLDSIVDLKFYISYEYSVDINEPKTIYKQTIEHKMDSLTGKFKTIKIFDRTKVKLSGS